MSIPAFVQTKTISYRGRNYTIKNLEKEYLPNTDYLNRMYRSALYNASGKMIALAPLQSFPNDNFVLDLSNGDSANFIINEIIEGTMMTLFWDPDENCWDVCTKKGLGGNYSYFRDSGKTFRTMFLEALETKFPLNTLDEADFSAFDKSLCYTFVLQHPANHIVIYAPTPKLYLVGAFKLAEARNKPLSEFSFTFVPPKNVNTGSLNVSVPSDYGAETVSMRDLPEVLRQLQNDMSNPSNNYMPVGYMLTNVETGFRCAYYNDRYLEVKILRGNNPNIHYQYLVLRKVGKVSEFLYYFPMYHEQFSKFFEHFKMFCERIQKLYWRVFVKKEMTMEDITCSKDKFFINKLHYEYFIPGKKANPKFFITQKVVAQMMDSQNIMMPF